MHKHLLLGYMFSKRKLKTKCLTNKLQLESKQPNAAPWTLIDLTWSIIFQVSSVCLVESASEVPWPEGGREGDRETNNSTLLIGRA